MSWSSVTTAVTFADLGTYSELEGFLYGGPEAITWFVAAVQKANWFSLVPIVLRHDGLVDFGTKRSSASVNRSGDYVLNTWFRCQIPRIQLFDAGTAIYVDASLRWTRNLMHNLFTRVSISFNELVVHEFDNFWLDCNFVFRVPSNKRLIYDNMIGNVSDMTTAVPRNTALGTGGYFSVVLPFFFGEDSGVALPVAAVPLNDVKINYELRRWQELVVVFPGTAAGGAPGTRIAALGDVKQYTNSSLDPQLLDSTTNAHYAVVHNDERVKMGDAPRDIPIHQTQSIQLVPFKDVSSATSFDLRLSHAIVLFCFAALNTTINTFTSGACGQELSNYTTEPNYAGLDPIAYTTLVYENSVRLSNGSDYYSYIFPFLYADGAATEPEHTGMHMFSYSIKPWSPLSPAGSTNFSKLSNVSCTHTMSPACIAAAASTALDSSGVAIQWPTGTPSALANMPQTFSHAFVARNWNIVRVANALTMGRNRQLPCVSTGVNSYCLVSCQHEARYLGAGNSQHLQLLPSLGDLRRAPRVMTSGGITLKWRQSAGLPSLRDGVSTTERISVACA